MTDTVCPCEECICRPKCRHRGYLEIFRMCDMLKEFEPKYDVSNMRSRLRIQWLELLLQPTLWFTSIGNASGNVYIHYNSRTGGRL